MQKNLDDGNVTEKELEELEVWLMGIISHSISAGNFF